MFINNKPFESIYVLKQLNKHVSKPLGMSLLQHVTEILFLSKDESELKNNLQSYSNTLRILTGIKNRIEFDSEIFSLVSKNII
jgi:hypothetical protein